MKGCFGPIDAMGCQTAIASTIVKGGGDYPLAVKGNQPTLHIRASGAGRVTNASLDGRNRQYREKMVVSMGASTMYCQPVHWQQFPEWKNAERLASRYPIALKI